MLASEDPASPLKRQEISGTVTSYAPLESTDTVSPPPPLMVTACAAGNEKNVRKSPIRLKTEIENTQRIPLDADVCYVYHNYTPACRTTTPEKRLHAPSVRGGSAQSTRLDSLLR